jgi:hypothetical protein
MKKIYFIFLIIIFITNISHAQKHELQIGTPGAFYFDEKLPMMHRLKSLPFFPFLFFYTMRERTITSNISIAS